jgi:pimeloyl-ACP methyl ester carboxylesterase
MIDIGEGPPLVLIPGIQGRWEWMAPAARTLAARCRVITFSLPGEPRSGCAHDPASGFDMFVAQIDAALDAAGLDSAAICGVSFGGLVALIYAARRPERTRALALVSAPGPRWQPDVRARRYMRAPARSIPAFVAGAPGRMYPEVAAALPAYGARLRFVAQHLGRLVAAPMSPRRMADRLRLVDPAEMTAACARVTAPTLVVTGELSLDRVVPVSGTREYGTAIRGAVVTELVRTGHLGLVTRPREFAALVAGFVAEHAGPAPSSRAVAVVGEHTEAGA